MNLIVVKNQTQPPKMAARKIFAFALGNLNWDVKLNSAPTKKAPIALSRKRDMSLKPTNTDPP